MNFSGTVRLNTFGICVILATLILFYVYVFSGSAFSRQETKSTVNLRKLLITAIEVAEKGGKQVKLALNGTNLNKHSKGKTKEGAEMLVTNADSQSHCVMYFGLEHTFPHLKVISEEQEASKLCDITQPVLDLDPASKEGLSALEDSNVFTDDLTVWIDPLDATQEYTENLVQYVTTMVCVAYKGRPIIGVIHKPLETEPVTYWAWIEQGKSSSLDKLFSTRKTLEKTTTIVSRSHAGKVANLAKGAFGSDSVIIPAGGAGYKTLAVISGNASLYVHMTQIKKWDICAADAILQSVGGKMTTLQNELIDYASEMEKVNEHGIVASVTTHSEFVKKLGEELLKSAASP